jgi:hypothetical protein
MRMCMIAVFVFLVAAPRAEARPATEYENFCLEAMSQIERNLTAHLPSDCEMADTHSSRLGKKFAQATYIRDGWISRNGQVVVKVVLFAQPMPNDPLLSGATISQVKLETERGRSKVTLGIAILGQDEQLVSTVADIVNRSFDPPPSPDIPKKVRINGSGEIVWVLLMGGAIILCGLIIRFLIRRTKQKQNPSQ